MYLSKSRMRGRTTTKQLLLIMQLTGLLLTICCLTATAKVTSQITLKAENAPLKEVFNQIHQQSGYDIFYNGELVRAAGKVTVTLNSVTLEQALAACLEGKDLTYQITDRTVIIKRKLSVDLNPRKSHTPPIDIKGRVVDEQGQPVIASVVIKGTNRGTTTNEMGEFSLKAVDDNAIIVFSGVGIELLEVAINGKATFDITVKTLVKSLDETVIKGYYSTTKKN
jgi:TonB-dependent starch-binding outer membrane protein SusC